MFDLVGVGPLIQSGTCELRTIISVSALRVSSKFNQLIAYAANLGSRYRSFHFYSQGLSDIIIDAIE